LGAENIALDLDSANINNTEVNKRQDFYLQGVGLGKLSKTDFPSVELSLVSVASKQSTSVAVTAVSDGLVATISVLQSGAYLLSAKAGGVDFLGSPYRLSFAPGGFSFCWFSLVLSGCIAVGLTLDESSLPLECALYRSGGFMYSLGTRSRASLPRQASDNQPQFHRRIWQRRFHSERAGRVLTFETAVGDARMPELHPPRGLSEKELCFFRLH
jgi:hypothetical protein